MAKILPEKTLRANFARFFATSKPAENERHWGSWHGQFMERIRQYMVSGAFIFKNEHLHEIRCCIVYIFYYTGHRYLQAIEAALRMSTAIMFFLDLRLN